MRRQNCTHTIINSQWELQSGSPPWISRIARLLNSWAQRSQQRRDLARLSDAALKDIGLSRGHVHEEIAKPFWRS